MMAVVDEVLDVQHTRRGHETLTLTQAVEWYVGDRGPSPPKEQKQLGHETLNRPRLTPRTEGPRGSTEPDGMTLTQAVQWWQEQEEGTAEKPTPEPLPRPTRGEEDEVKKQVRGFDLSADRPFTIGVGQGTPDMAVDTNQRNMVVGGLKAQRVMERQEHLWDTTTWLQGVPEHTDVQEWDDVWPPPAIRTQESPPQHPGS